MENTTIDVDLDRRIAQRLKALRLARGWSLDELAGMAGVSRATLSRLENAEVSPTASVPVSYTHLTLPTILLV